MQKVSYMGDGSTTDFYFNFPFYTNTDVIVLKNTQTATDYTVVGTPAGLNADIPYTGGKIVFNNAPVATDSITIYRHLPLSRIVDYQPTEKINPTILNQDMNYTMEILKDMQDKIDVFSEQYDDIVNKESTDNLLSKIHYIKQLIDNDEIINKYTSNCITKIPQDLKIELNNGTFTLKTGSKIYVPNGAGVFDEVVLTVDKTITPSTFSTSSNRMIICRYGSLFMLTTTLQYVYSGDTAPTTFDSNGRAFWYDTANNNIKFTDNSGSTWISDYAFPIALVNITNGIGVTAINQTFNGFGYIGSTIYALPGVKGLIPNGRNADGSCKNTTWESTQVITKTFTDTAVSNLVFQGTSFDCGSYKLDSDNYLYNNTGAKVISTVIGILNKTNGKITTFNTKQPYQALDYNDSSYIAHQAMPSSLYLDLTLGVSGTTYTAPADGYFVVNKAAATSGEYINLINNTNNTNVNSIATGAMNCRLMIPVSKNNVVTVNYTTTGTTNWFRFVYANGSK